MRERRKCGKEESSSGDYAMCFGWAKVAKSPNVAKMSTERVSGIAKDSGTGKLMRRESGLLGKAVQK